MTQLQTYADWIRTFARQEATGDALLDRMLFHAYAYWLRARAFPTFADSVIAISYEIDAKTFAEIMSRNPLPRCHRCDGETATVRGQHTYYPNKASNYAVLCDACHEENASHWDTMWEEYYRSVL